MPKVVLTDLTLSKLKSEAQTRYWCNALPGFGVLVGKRRKTFIVMHGRDRKLLTLGQYPTVALKQARRAALVLLSADTSTQPQEAPTARAKVEEYITAHGASPGWVKEQERLLTKHFLTRHAAKAVSDITTAQVLAITDSLAKTPSEQIHAHRAMKAFFNWMLQRRVIPHSPLAGLPLPSKPRTRDRVLEPFELKAIWHACDDNVFCQIVRLLILTGQRRGEITALQPDWIDGVLLTIPAAFTKNGKEHTLPLSPLTLEIAAAAPFKFNGWTKSKTRLDGKAGVTEWTLHDLRRTYSTTLASLQVEPHIIERLLNHSTGTISGVAATYNRYKYLDEMRRAVQLHADYIAKNVTSSV